MSVFQNNPKILLFISHKPWKIYVHWTTDLADQQGRQKAPITPLTCLSTVTKLLNLTLLYLIFSLRSTVKPHRQVEQSDVSPRPIGRQMTLTTLHIRLRCLETSLQIRIDNYLIRFSWSLQIFFPHYWLHISHLPKIFMVFTNFLSTLLTGYISHLPTFTLQN